MIVSVPALLNTKEIPMLSANPNVSSTQIVPRIWRAGISIATTPVLVCVAAMLNVKSGVIHLSVPAYRATLAMPWWNVSSRRDPNLWLLTHAIQILAALTQLPAGWVIIANAVVRSDFKEILTPSAGLSVQSTRIVRPPWPVSHRNAATRACMRTIVV